MVKHAIPLKFCVSLSSYLAIQRGLPRDRDPVLNRQSAYGIVDLVISCKRVGDAQRLRLYAAAA